MKHLKARLPCAAAVIFFLAFPVCAFPQGSQLTGLVAAFSLDQGTGAVLVDSSGAANNGTVSGAQWVAGRFGSGLWFNGSTSYTITAPSRNFPISAITVEFWVRTSDVRNQGTPISYAVSGSVNEFRILDYNNLQISVKGLSTGLTGVSVNDGVWHHLAVTWRSSDGQVRILKDGLVAFTGVLASGASIIGNGALVLGQSQGTVGGGFNATQAFRGLLDEVRIYNRVLSQAEIQSDSTTPITSPDNIPPTITSVAANPGRTTAVITWSTTEPADTQVEYGLTTSYGSVTSLDPSAVVTHAGTLFGLQSSTTYHYRVRSLDAAGNLAVSGDGIFTTLNATAPTGIKIAFIGDQGLGGYPTAVLQLIKNEGAQAAVHLGDFDYVDSPGDWNQQITLVLGASYPYFAVIGNHDIVAWPGYQQRMLNRLSQVPDASCTGDVGVQSTCIYKGVLMLSTAPGLLGVGHDAYIRDQLAQSNFAWRISGWHVLQQLMQVGLKTDEAGWGVYEESRKGGAIVATAHEHSYERTYLMSNFQNQTVASTANPLQIAKGQSFAFVSGLGGDSVRSQFLSGPWWASIYTWDQWANFGALFCTFGANDQPYRASCYFKDIDGAVPDQFDLVSVVGSTPPTVSITAPAAGTTVSGTITVSATATSSVGIAGVQFKVDGNNIGSEAILAPYSVSLNTMTLTNGSHVLTAVARDLAGITAASAPVSVTVSNPLTISGVSASSITTTSAAISWTTNMPATSQVDYGTTISYGQSTALDTALVASHSQTLSGLLASTTYHYRVKSADAAGNLVMSGDFTFATLAPLPGAFRDDFNSTTLDPGWSFTDPLGNSSYSLTANPGHLQISVPAGSGHDCWGTTYNTCARMLRAVPNGNGIYEVKIDGANINTAYQGYGIFLYQDAANFLRFEYWTDGGGVSLNAWATIGGVGFQGVAGPSVTLGFSNYLRVTRTSDTFRLDYSSDGVTWLTAGSFIQPFTVNKAGVYVMNGGANVATTANFDYFSWTR